MTTERKDLQVGLEEVSQAFESQVLSPSRAERRRRVLAASTTSRRPGLVPMLATAAGLVLLGLVVWLGSRGPGAITVALEGSPVARGALVAAPADHGLPLVFSEGTAVQVEPLSRVRVGRLDAQGADLVLEAGRLEARVVHRPKARWQVDAGPYQVRVRGTAFRVAWDPVAQDLAVQLFEGSIELAGPVVDRRVLRPGDELSVQGGSRLEFVDGARRAGVDAAVPAPPEPQAPVVDPDAGAASESPPAPASPAIAPKRPEPWERAARAQDWAEAIRLAEGRGFRQLTGSLDVERLLLLADAARFSGQTGRAVEALSALRRRFPRRPEHHEAAYLLGRVHADQRKDPVEGARWFETAYAEAPDGPLAEESLARALELAVARSDGGKARALAAEYLARFPAGPHASGARRAVAEKGP